MAVGVDSGAVWVLGLTEGWGLVESTQTKTAPFPSPFRSVKWPDIPLNGTQVLAQAVCVCVSAGFWCVLWPCVCACACCGLVFVYVVALCMCVCWGLVCVCWGPVCVCVFDRPIVCVGFIILMRPAQSSVALNGP